MGVIARYWPAQQKSEVIISGLDHQLYGVALTARGGVVVAEQGTGRILAVADGKSEVLANGLRQPSGVAVGSDGVVYFTEQAGGRVDMSSGGRGGSVRQGVRGGESEAVSVNLGGGSTCKKKTQK